MIIKNNQSDNYKEKMQRCLKYVESLEEERRKIQVFQRELPLCLELVSQAIETCRKELHFQGQSECSEQTSSEGPVLEEFIPIKRTTSQEHVQNQQPKKAKNIVSSKDSKSSDKSSKKSDWLRSVQLWNHTPDPPTKQDSPRKVSVVEVKKNGSGGAFHPFKKEKSLGAAQSAAPVAAASSTAETGGSSGGGSKCEDKEDSQRKARRCWSPELHRRFLQALQQLGGAHVATPKQIRELMKVDGLTNDEVKSHLQKYRLHTRRPSPSIHSNNPQAPPFVVVGGIWVPPPEYAASTVATTKAAGEAALVLSPHNGVVYAPRATVPSALQEATGSFKHSQQSKEFDSSERGSHSDGSGHSNSPATSSSTHTTTASPAF